MRQYLQQEFCLFGLLVQLVLVVGFDNVRKITDSPVKDARAPFARQKSSRLYTDQNNNPTSSPRKKVTEGDLAAVLDPPLSDAFFFLIGLFTRSSIETASWSICSLSSAGKKNND